MRAELIGICRDRRVAGKMILGRMSANTDEIAFHHRAIDELTLQKSAKMPRSSKQHKTCRVRVKTMHRTWHMRRTGEVEQMLERVAMIATTRMHRQWRRLSDQHHSLVEVQNADVGRDIGFHFGRENLQNPFARAHDMILATDLATVIHKASGIAA